MGCLPRSACLGSRCLTHHKDLLILGESLEIWNYQVWYVPSKVVFDAMTIHFDPWGKFGDLELPRIMAPKVMSQAAIERLITQRVDAAMEAEQERQ
ncbi:hypothetical protein Tco_1518422, partial [Tanacetum coccineum]